MFKSDVKPWAYCHKLSFQGHGSFKTFDQATPVSAHFFLDCFALGSSLFHTLKLISYQPLSPLPKSQEKPTKKKKLYQGTSSFRTLDRKRDGYRAIILIRWGLVRCARAASSQPITWRSRLHNSSRGWLHRYSVEEAVNQVGFRSECC